MLNEHEIKSSKTKFQHDSDQCFLTNQVRAVRIENVKFSIRFQCTKMTALAVLASLNRLRHKTL